MAKKALTNEELIEVLSNIMGIMEEGLDNMTVVITNKNSVKEVRIDGNIFEQLIQEIVANAED